MKTNSRDFIRTMALGAAAAVTAGGAHFAHAEPANKPKVVVVLRAYEVISSLLTEFFPFSSTPLLLPTPTVQHTDSLLPICLDHTSQDRRKSRDWLREVFF
jgi:hypothetical protein